MARAPDQKSWRQSFRDSWLWCRWMLLVMPLGAIIPWVFIKPDPAGPMTRDDINGITLVLLGVTFVMWLLIYLSQVQMDRNAKTPMEREAEERALYEQLHSKYGNQDGTR